MVFRFGLLVAMLDHMVQDFVYGIYFAKSTPRNDQQNHSGNDGQQRGESARCSCPTRFGD